MGSKRDYVQQILERMPTTISTFVDPFVGGGSVLNAVLASGRIRPGERVVAGDANALLIDTFIAVRDSVETLITAVRLLEKRCTSHSYYAARDRFNSNPTPALFLYLNRRCFRGLYRVNRRGEFNVPYGCAGQRNVPVDADHLRRVSRMYRRFCVHFVHGDWRHTVDFARIQLRAGVDMLVFLDPPYAGTFADYTPNRFEEEDQTQLMQWMQTADDRVVYCNAARPSIMRALADWDVTTRMVRRSICASDPSKTARECIARNFVH